MLKLLSWLYGIFHSWQHLLGKGNLSMAGAYVVGRRCSLRSTDASNFIKIVVLGLGAPFTATKCAVTLHNHSLVNSCAGTHRLPAECKYLAGKPAPSRAPFTMPAMNAAQFS